jgi:hypothetical protein
LPEVSSPDGRTDLSRDYDEWRRSSAPSQKHSWNKGAAIELEKRRPGFLPPHLAWSVDANCKNPRAKDAAWGFVFEVDELMASSDHSGE